MTPFKQSPERFSMICILGATATGKTHLGVQLAARYSGEIISADSRQVYQGLDIGSGKDLHEYGDVPYHLIDEVAPCTEFNVFEFVKAYNRAVQDITARNRRPFLVGGTGMYLDAILSRYAFATCTEHDTQMLDDLDTPTLVARLQALQPKLHNQTDLIDRQRTIRAIQVAQARANGNEVVQALPCDSLVIGIAMPRSRIRERITSRLKQRLQNGMIEEVEHLHAEGLAWSQLDFFGLEYRFVAQYLQGQLNYNDMYQKLNAAIHKFAKQQEKWFRNLEKKGHRIEWIEAGPTLMETACEKVDAFIERSA